MYKHILIPTDGSELSDKAMKHGVAFAGALNASITGLHVIPSNFALYYEGIGVIDKTLQDKMREYARADGTDYLDRIQAAAQSAGVTYDRMLLQADEVWKGIIEAARTSGCDLILMAAHGRRGLSALMLGSETNKVLTHAEIPVLVVR